MAWILVGPTVGTYLLNLMALRSVSPTLVGLFIALQPFVAAALAIPMLGERPGLRELAAGLLAVTGVAWASWRPRPTGGLQRAG
jgi:drug/metabolite transporter (DMT)-like permease